MIREARRFDTPEILARLLESVIDLEFWFVVRMTEDFGK